MSVSPSTRRLIAGLALALCAGALTAHPDRDFILPADVRVTIDQVVPGQSWDPTRFSEPALTVVLDHQGHDRKTQTLTATINHNVNGGAWTPPFLYSHSECLLAEEISIQLLLVELDEVGFVAWVDAVARVVALIEGAVGVQIPTPFGPIGISSLIDGVSLLLRVYNWLNPNDDCGSATFQYSRKPYGSFPGNLQLQGADCSATVNLKELVIPGQIPCRRGQTTGGGPSFQSTVTRAFTGLRKAAQTINGITGEAGNPQAPSATEIAAQQASMRTVATGAAELLAGGLIDAGAHTEGIDQAIPPFLEAQAAAAVGDTIGALRDFRAAAKIAARSIGQGNLAEPVHLPRQLLAAPTFIDTKPGVAIPIPGRVLGLEPGEAVTFIEVHGLPPGAEAEAVATGEADVLVTLETGRALPGSYTVDVVAWVGPMAYARTLDLAIH